MSRMFQALKSIRSSLSSVEKPNDAIKVAKHKHISGNDQCKVFMFFHFLLSYVPKDKNLDTLYKAFAGSITESAEAGRKQLLLGENTSVDESNMFHIDSNLSEMSIHNYINYVSEGLIPSPKMVVDILMKATCRCEKFDNIRRLTLCSKLDKCVVVGDLHGQFNDLLHIIHKFGFPNENLIYVFNGDIVDRGEHSVEVLTLICLLMVLWPASVYINRGNHEDFIMFMRYGFKEECYRKYQPEHAAIILRAFHDFCAALPLGTEVDGHEKALVVHGGIPAGTSISKIQTIDRRKFKSLLFPPVEFSHLNSEVITDITWSDPTWYDGISANKFRRAGKFFGPNVTTYFLKSNKLDMLIRSHEVVTEGYGYHHANQVLTVFSASNYTENASNKGAVVILRSDKQHELWNYTAPAYISITSSSNSVRNTSLYTVNQELYEEAKSAGNILFGIINTSKTGYITEKELKSVMRKIYVKNMKWKRKDAPEIMKICSLTHVDRIYPDDLCKALAIAMEILP